MRTRTRTRNSQLRQLFIHQMLAVRLRDVRLYL